jgi:hypothetical protein
LAKIPLYKIKTRFLKKKDVLRYIRSKKMIAKGSEILPMIDDEVQNLLEKAMIRAMGNNRKTVRGKDV